MVARPGVPGVLARGDTLLSGINASARCPSPLVIGLGCIVGSMAGRLADTLVLGLVVLRGAEAPPIHDLPGAARVAVSAALDVFSSARKSASMVVQQRHSRPHTA